MNNKHSKFAIFLPIIIALSIIVGILISQVLNIGGSKYEAAQNSGNKIQDVLNLIDTYYVDSLKTDSIEDIMIADFLHNLDPHSSYMTAKETAQTETELTGNFVGIGIRFYILHDTVMVTNIIPGGASEKVGLMAGDRIVEVDGKQMAGIGISNDSVRGRILGENGKKVKIKILRDGKPIDFTIKRAPVEVESVYYSKIGDIGYIKVTSFSENTAFQFEDAALMLKKEGIKSMVIDLRDNTGGFMHVAKSILDNFFNEKKLLVYTQGVNTAREEVYSTGRNGMCSKYPLAILVNENSASASEITAGVIQDYDLGTVIGNVTFGKGLVQRMFNLSDGSSVRLTISRYYLPSGRCIQRSYADGYISYLENFYMNYGKNKQTVDSSKVFYTLKEHRKMYEGDGIMPDITIEHDTSFYTSLIGKVSEANIISTFCVEYYDNNRKKLSAMNVNTASKLNNYIENDKMFDKFMKAVKDKGIEYSQEDLKKSEKYLKKILKYQIASYCLDMNTACAILLEDDNYWEAAKKVLDR